MEPLNYMEVPTVLINLDVPSVAARVGRGDIRRFLFSRRSARKLHRSDLEDEELLKPCKILEEDSRGN
jgi:hypothetical protein